MYVLAVAFFPVFLSPGKHENLWDSLVIRFIGLLEFLKREDFHKFEYNIERK